jgi:hypothetical protein
VLTGLIQFYYFGTWFPWYVTVVLTGILLWIIIIHLRRNDAAGKYLLSGALVVGFFGFYLNSTFFPALIRYQSETTLTNYLIDKNIDAANVIGFRKSCYPVGLKTQTIVPVIHDVNNTLLYKRLLFTDEFGLSALREIYPRVDIIEVFDDYRITQLHPKFVNRATRNEVLRKAFLVKIETRSQ